MKEETTIKEIIKLLIANDLKRIDSSVFIGSKEFSLKAYRVGIKLFRIDVEDLLK